MFEPSYYKTFYINKHVKFQHEFVKHNKQGQGGNMVAVAIS